ncbi:MAG: hypothetical protein AAFY22_02780 [Pseudomonadota bacterium]
MVKSSTMALLAGCFVLAGCSGDDTSEADSQADAASVVEAAPLEAPEAEPLPALDEPAYVGVWASAPGACEAAPGAEGATPVVFTIGEFIGDGELCRIGHAEEGTENGWRLEMICTDEDGVEFTDLVELDVDGNQLRLVRQGKPEAVYSRCVGA